jgi:hypothetical protein
MAVTENHGVCLYGREIETFIEKDRKKAPDELKQEKPYQFKG